MFDGIFILLLNVKWIIKYNIRDDDGIVWFVILCYDNVVGKVLLVFKRVVISYINVKWICF